MPPGSGMGRMSICQVIYKIALVPIVFKAVDTLERFGKRLEIASRDAPIGYGSIVEIHSITAIVAYKLVTHFMLPSNMARCHLYSSTKPLAPRSSHGRC